MRLLTIERMTRAEFRKQLEERERFAESRGWEWTAGTLHEARARIERGESARKMCAWLGAFAIAVALAAVFSHEPHPKACSGPADTRVVPLDPTVIRAQRSEAIEI